MYSDHYIFKSILSNQIAFAIIKESVVLNPGFDILPINKLIELIQKVPELRQKDMMSQEVYENR